MALSTSLVGVILFVLVLMLVNLTGLDVLLQGIMFAVSMSLICFATGRIYLKYSKCEHKEYYHTFWTGAWSCCILVLIFLIITARLNF